MIIHRYGKPFVFSTSVLLGGLHLGNWMGSDASFQVQKIEVQGCTYSQAEPIRAEAHELEGKSIFEADLSAIAARVEELPHVERARVTRVFPATIRITIDERRAIALLNDGQLRPLDGTGHVLPRFQSVLKADLPIVSGVTYSKENPGTELAEGGIRLCEFIAALQAQQPVLYHQISEFHFGRKNDLTIFLLHRGVPVRLGHEGWLEKCDRLQAVLPQLSSQTAKTAAIDLRFENQVVTRAAI